MMPIHALRLRGAGGAPPPPSGAYDPANKSSKITLSEANARMTLGSSPSSWNLVSCVSPRSSGKRYAELQLASNHYASVGVIPQPAVLAGEFTSPDGAGLFTVGECAVWSSVRLFQGGGVYDNKNLITNASGDVLGMFFDLDSGKVWVSRNGVLFEGDPVAGTGASYTMTSLGTKLLIGSAFEDSATNRIRTKAGEFSASLLSGWIGWDD